MIVNISDEGVRASRVPVKLVNNYVRVVSLSRLGIRAATATPATPAFPATFRARGAGHDRGMQPHTPPTGEMPTDLLITRVTIGMTVVDVTGTQAGTVTAVQSPGTDVRPDMPAGIAEHFMAAGYIRIDGTGFLTNDTYAAGDEIAAIDGGDPGVVELRIPCDGLYRAAG